MFKKTFSITFLMPLALGIMLIASIGCDNSIAGMVTLNGTGVPGVSIRFVGGDQDETVLTDKYGEYYSPDGPDGTYTITPSYQDDYAVYEFAPVNRVVTVSRGDEISGQDFAVVCHSTISGTVFYNGIGVEGIQVRVRNDFYEEIVVTNHQGDYISSLLPDGRFKIEVAEEGTVFTPISQGVIINGQDITDIDFNILSADFTKIFDFPNVQEVIYGIDQTLDGGYAACMTVISNPESISLEKVNPLGVAEWTSTFPSAAGFAMDTTADQGFIVGGYGISTPGVLLIKYNSSGTETWHRWHRISEDNYGQIVSIQQTSDGGYISANNFWSSNIFAKSCFVAMKFNSSGYETWSQLYCSYNANNNARSIEQTSDGGYIMAGDTDDYNGSPGTYKDFFIVKIDALGNEEWRKQYGIQDVSENAVVIHQTSDGGYIVAGNTSTGNGNGIIMKLDSSGEKTWEKTYGTADYSEEIIDLSLTSDGGFIFTGTYSNPAGIWAMKLNSAGTEQWSKTYSVSGYIGHGDRIKQANDGGYVIGGRYFNQSTGHHYAVIKKVNASGDM